MRSTERRKVNIIIKIKIIIILLKQDYKGIIFLR